MAIQESTSLAGGEPAAAGSPKAPARVCWASSVLETPPMLKLTIRAPVPLMKVRRENPARTRASAAPRATLISVGERDGLFIGLSTFRDWNPHPASRAQLREAYVCA